MASLLPKNAPAKAAGSATPCPAASESLALAAELVGDFLEGCTTLPRENAPLCNALERAMAALQAGHAAGAERELHGVLGAAKASAAAGVTAFGATQRERAALFAAAALRLLESSPAASQAGTAPASALPGAARERLEAAMNRIATVRSTLRVLRLANSRAGADLQLHGEAFACTLEDLAGGLKAAQAQLDEPPLLASEGLEAASLELWRVRSALTLWADACGPAPEHIEMCGEAFPLVLGDLEDRLSATEKRLGEAWSAAAAERAVRPAPLTH